MLTIIDKQKTLFERKKRLLAKQTPSELKIAALLTSLNINFIPQKAFIAHGFYCFVDFYLPKPIRVCIEVDGGYHTTPEQTIKDKGRDKYLNLRGFHVVRITNESANSMQAEELQTLITKTALKPRQKKEPKDHIFIDWRNA